MLAAAVPAPPTVRKGKSMNMSAYGVTELTLEEACAAAGGQDPCGWLITPNPDGTYNIVPIICTPEPAQSA
jgi:hypothetical protein